MAVQITSDNFNEYFVNAQNEQSKAIEAAEKEKRWHLHF